MLSKARHLLPSVLARFRLHKYAFRCMSDKPKEQALKFEIGGKQQTFKVVDEQAEANKFYGFFSTLKGQKLVGSFWIVASALGAMWHIAPNWFFLERVKQIYQNYSNGFPTRVRDEMLGLINDVTIDMKLEEQEVKSIGVFVLTSTEPFAWGELGRDCLVGFPEFYHFNDVQEVPIQRMRFGSMLDTGSNYLLTSAQLESEQAASFCSSLVLSNDAKKFSIAREIERTRLQPYMTYGVFSFAFILLNYNAARILNKKLGLMKRPPLFRGLLYVGLLPTMVMSYLLVKDTFTRYMEREVDRRAAGISPEYSDGGVEYYSKILQRNIALRELEGDGGKTRYTGKGEVIQGIVRVKHASLQDRRDVCERNRFMQS